MHQRLVRKRTLLPAGATFDKNIRTFRWTPTAAQVGRHSVTFSVPDGKATDLETVAITVTAS